MYEVAEEIELTPPTKVLCKTLFLILAY